MNIKHGRGKTIYGPGVEISLTGDEVATAISSYLVAHGVYVNGPRTITVNNELIEAGQVYVDPNGSVYHCGGVTNGNGFEEDTQ